jgi:DNA-binding MarR family transcriptional regulator
MAGNALSEQAAGDLIALIPLYHRTIFRQGMKFSGTRIARFKILNILSLYGLQPMSAIGRRLSVSKPYMTSLIDGMIDEGLVLRQPDRDDRRVILIGITKKGRDYLRKMEAALKGDIRGLLASIDEHDLELLCSSLQGLRSVLRKVDGGD